MNKGMVTALKWMAAGFVAVFLISQFYSAVIIPVTTDTVYAYSSYNGYSTSGYIIRNETVVEQQVEGTLGYEIQDGDRVSKNGTIANIYSGGSDAEIRTKIEELDKKIESLKNIQNYNDVNAADLSSLNVKIHNAITAMADSTQNGFVDKNSASPETLLESINRYQIITGQTSDFKGLIASLEAERNGLKASSDDAIGKITASESGYVIYSVDGYENVVPTEDITTITAEMMQNIKPNEVGKNTICKIVNDYEWYIAVVMPFSEVLNLREGNKIKVKTALQSAPELTATVKSINKQSVQDNAVVVLACNTMNTELAATRNLDITLIYNQYDGLKVDNRAIRIVDEQKGVYVLLSSQVKFVPIKIIWSGENYSIVEQEKSTTRVLRIYDEIIVKGKNLYDGKIIR